MGDKGEWCVYGGFTPWGIGKIVSEHKSGILEIKYSEGQMYPAELWDPDYVKRFTNAHKAAEFYSERMSEPLGFILEREVERMFPEDFREEVEVKKSFLECLASLLDSRK